MTKTAVGSPEPEDNDSESDYSFPHYPQKHNSSGFSRYAAEARKWDHRGNIAHEHIGGMHESEALGYEERCPDCKADWDKRRGLH